MCGMRGSEKGRDAQVHMAVRAREHVHKGRRVVVAREEVLEVGEVVALDGRLLDVVERRHLLLVAALAADVERKVGRGDAVVVRRRAVGGRLHLDADVEDLEEACRVYQRLVRERESMGKTRSERRRTWPAMKVLWSCARREGEREGSAGLSQRSRIEESHAQEGRCSPSRGMLLHGGTSAPKRRSRALRRRRRQGSSRGRRA